MLLVLLLSCTCGTAQVRAQVNVDPWAFINHPVYEFNQLFDTVLVKPAALGYQHYVPQQARTGIRNFFNNLDDINVVVNDLLQLKFEQTLNDSSRLLLNSTLGLGGFLDPASAMGLYKHYEDFGQTLGYWGIGDGGYLVLPILGASTLRDTVGMVPDYLLNPLRVVRPEAARAGMIGLDIVDTRLSYLVAETMISGDEYSFVRNAYLQRRAYLVADGEIEDEFDDY